MNRITSKLPNGEIVLFNRNLASENDLSTKQLDILAEKLNKYENTELTPKEIERLKIAKTKRYNVETFKNYCERSYYIGLVVPCDFFNAEVELYEDENLIVRGKTLLFKNTCEIIIEDYCLIGHKSPSQTPKLHFRLKGFFKDEEYIIEGNYVSSLSCLNLTECQMIVTPVVNEENLVKITIIEGEQTNGI